MERPSIPAADELLEKKLPVLDHGFLRLVDYMGGDARIVQSARVSYGPGTKTVHEDRGLIRYLLRHGHMSPFEQVILTFHAKMPIFVARQWVRHRTARLNEISGRYSILPEEYYVPAEEDIALQAKNNRQGRSSEEVPPELRSEVAQAIDSASKAAFKAYHELIEKGITREVARVVLPLNTYTEWYWQSDLRNILHFIRLRMDFHAQREIQVYAEAMATCVKAVAPLTWEAFEDYVLGAKGIPQKQADRLAELLADHPDILKECGIDPKG